MKLKYYLNEKGEKVYTLKQSHDNNQTKEAHYKFLKFTDAL